MSTTDPNTLAETMAQQMKLTGVTPEQIAAAFHGIREQHLVGDYLEERVRPNLTPGKRTAFGPYLNLITDGYPDLCACMCSDCLETFRGDSQWTPCSCVQQGVCDCSEHDLADSPVGAKSCLESCVGIGDQDLASLRVADLDRIGAWAELRALKRTAVRNLKRGAAGRPTFSHDGRSARERVRDAFSHIYRVALGDVIPGISRNLAKEMQCKPRPAPQARAYTVEQLDELWNAIFTSGSDDTDLDMLMIWFCLETGSRRGGLLKLTVGDLLFATNEIRLGEKNNKVDLQPASGALLAALLGHALQRGDIVVSTCSGLDAEDVCVGDVISGRAVLRTDAPVAYFRNPRKATKRVRRADGSTKKRPVLDDSGDPILEPHPLTGRRFDTLWNRLKTELPWLDQMHGRPHDLRKTMGTFIERAYGHAVSQRWLRHGVSDSTGIYTLAGPAETRAAHAWIIGAADRQRDAM